jgi:hypothetical protein
MEEYSLRVFEKWVLRRVFGTKENKATRERRNVNIEELHSFYSSTSKIIINIQMVRWAHYVARIRRR